MSEKREPRREWTPVAAANRLTRLMYLAGHGATPEMLREIGELGVLLNAPVAGTA